MLRLTSLTPTKLFSLLAVLLLSAIELFAAPVPDDHSSIVIVLKDGHHETLQMAEIARIDFKTPVVIFFKNGHQRTIAASDIVRIDFDSTGTVAVSRNHFIGKWEVGEGGGTSSKFFITLEANGEASKTLGASHGTWTVVDGEARISWDDGWHDAIRKVGSKHEKAAYGPGKSFDDKPSNVTEAINTQPRPI
jgi:hypothetical protein